MDKLFGSDSSFEVVEGKKQGNVQISYVRVKSDVMSGDEVSDFDKKYVGGGHGGVPCAFDSKVLSDHVIELKEGENTIDPLYVATIHDLKSIHVFDVDDKPVVLEIQKKNFRKKSPDLTFEEFKKLNEPDPNMDELWKEELVSREEKKKNISFRQQKYTIEDPMKFRTLFVAYRDCLTTIVITAPKKCRIVIN